MTPVPVVERFVSQTGVRIYRIPCQAMPDLSGRVHLLLGAGPPTLVDTGSGSPRSIHQVECGLQAVRTEFGEPFAISDIRRILVTHGHIDHIAGLGEFVQRTGAEVYVHQLDSRAVASFDEHAVLSSKATRTFFRRAGVDSELLSIATDMFGHERGRSRSVPIAAFLSDGQEMDGLRFVHTPGHSPGQVCIVIGDVLLSADHILPVTVTQQWPELIGAYNGLGHYLESLEKIRRIEGIRIAMGGHEAAFENVYERIDHLRDTQHRRLQRVHDMLHVTATPMTIRQIATQMYTQARGVHAMLAVMDAGARVEYLYDRGDLTLVNLDEVELDDGIAYRYLA
jgi:glyoxylase-like metal-dependent hydrolase (beta-lactamase superfamily II)